MSKKTGFSTTNIMRHLASPPHNISEFASESAKKAAKLQPKIKDCFKKLRELLPFNKQQELRTLLNLFVIGAHLPFSILEAPTFKVLFFLFLFYGDFHVFVTSMLKGYFPRLF